MSACFEVLQPGLGSTVQDRGRHGHRHEGMPRSGWLDESLAEAANALVGNSGGEAVLELRGMGTELRAQGAPVRVALAGAIQAQLLGLDGQSKRLPAWQSATLQPGERLRLGAAESGCAYLAVAGGLSLPLLMGSRASYGRAGLPGVQGRAWRPGDRLPCGSWGVNDPRQWRAAPWTAEPGPLRVLLGPQQDHFQPAAIETFLSAEWQATPEQDRMGLRLRGPALAHVCPAAAEIVSDAVTPGAIQVPASGQPIVLLADSQTVGGYPKIATVISADLARLAHLPAGQPVRFAVVDAAQARQALLAQRQRWLDWLTGREAFVPAGFVDEQALGQCNLISGMLRAET